MIIKVENLLDKKLILDTATEVPEFKVSAEDKEGMIELVLYEIGLVVLSKEDDRWILQAR